MKTLTSNAQIHSLADMANALQTPWAFMDKHGEKVICVLEETNCSFQKAVDVAQQQDKRVKKATKDICWKDAQIIEMTAQTVMLCGTPLIGSTSYNALMSPAQAIINTEQTDRQINIARPTFIPHLLPSPQATSHSHLVAIPQMIACPEMPHVQMQLLLALSVPPVLAYPDAPHILTQASFVSLIPSMSAWLETMHGLTGPPLISPHVSHIPNHLTHLKFIDPALYYEDLIK
ncbi:hypothetical protein J3A83DRAFT_4375661 [Scleroderma citrinum]